MHLTQPTPPNCICSPQLDEFYHNMLWRLNEVHTQNLVWVPRWRRVPTQSSQRSCCSLVRCRDRRMPKTPRCPNLHFSFFLVFPKRRGTRRCRVFIDYCGVFQGNPIGGKSQNFAYSQYLPFGFEWKEPLGRHGSALRVSAVSGAGRDLSKSIGNAFTVSQAWDGNTLYLYQAYLAQKAFDDQLEIGIGRVSATQFFTTLPAFDLLLNGVLNSVPIAFKLNSTFTSSSSAS